MEFVDFIYLYIAKKKEEEKNFHVENPSRAALQYPQIKIGRRRREKKLYVAFPPPSWPLLLALRLTLCSRIEPDGEVAAAF